PALEQLIKAGHEIPLVICQPDKKKGRGQKFQFPPVKEYALEQEIEVFQPRSVKKEESIEKIKSYNADFFVVVAYGRILPNEIIDAPKKACINIHASLLPRWRGAAPIQFSLMEGDKEAGVTTMLIEEELDAGDMLLVEKTEILEDDNATTLANRLSEMGGRLILETLEKYDEITPIKQDLSQVTFARLLTKDDQEIQWSENNTKIFNQFRGLTPFPGVHTFFRGKRLKIKQMEKIEFSNSGKIGSIVAIEKDYFIVACGDGAIKVTECQPEGKKAMPVNAFLNGHQVKEGEMLGSNLA
ncbi:MAG: methionyl-tRNA formyltransferase, partial [bacterium]